MNHTPTLCGSLSLYPVSLGAKMHLAGYAALGLPWQYMPFAMRSEGLREALIGMRALGIRGLGVSMPFKIEVMPLLDHIDPAAARIGAVNTIVNEAGTLTGFNTDAEGAARALEETLGELSGKRCLILGAGGAARAVAYGLRDRGAQLTLANRTRHKAAALASELEASCLDWSVAVAQPGEMDVLVNATSAGMTRSLDQGEADCPVAEAALHGGLVVMDIVYKPIRTQLLARAAAAGASCIHGGRMLLHQAARQFELYTGQPAPLSAMARALDEALA